MTRSKPHFETGQFYHVYNRGAQRGLIFHRPLDYLRFLVALKYKMAGTDARLVAYCLMPNHFHLLILAGNDPFEKTMHRLEVSYARYFNATYGSSGHVFEERYRFRQAESEEDVINLSRYIHRNPSDIADYRYYPWSSYGDYIGRGQGLADPQPIIELLKDRDPLSNYEDYMAVKHSEKLLNASA